MAKWEEIVSGTKKTLGKAAMKVNEMADCAADSIKLESLKIKLCLLHRKILLHELNIGKRCVVCKKHVALFNLLSLTNQNFVHSLRLR